MTNIRPESLNKNVDIKNKGVKVMQELKKVDLQKGHSIMVASAERAIMKNQADIDSANTVLAKLNHAIKQLEVKRLEVTEPINTGLKKFNLLIKEVKLPLQTAYDILEGKVMAWRKIEQDKRDQESARLMEETRLKNEAIEREEKRRQKIRDAHEAKGHKVSDEPIEIEREIAPVVPDLKHTDSTQVRKHWQWHVVDESKIPRSYFVLDTVLIGKKVRQGCREIPGIRIYQDEIRVNQKVF